MEDKDFDRIKGSLEKQNAYFMHGYLTESIVRGLIQDPIMKYTDKQAREINNIFWEKIKEVTK